MTSAADRTPPEGALRLGRLGRTHGLGGALRLHLDVDADASGLLRVGATLHVGGHGSLTLREVRPHGRAVLVSFQGVRSPERAQVLVNEEVFVDAATLPEEVAGALREVPLEGVAVFVDGAPFGRVASVTRGPQPLALVRTDTGDRWLPMRAPYVRVGADRIDVDDPPPGLLDDDEG